MILTEDTIRHAPILVEHGVDLHDVSSGGILVGAVGGVGSGPIAEKVLEKGQADAIIVGRQFQ